jgi:hypothetical protein
MSQRDKDIELRSEKVRSIVGQVPPLLLRYGIVVISLVIILVLVLAYTVPYPQYISTPAKIYCNPPYTTLLAPQDGIIHIDDAKSLVKQEAKDSIFQFILPEKSRIMYEVGNLNNVKKGDVVYVAIPDSINKIYGISFISSDNISKIKTGQKVNFKPDANLSINQLMEGYVSRIYPLKIDSNNDKKGSYKVEITINFESLNPKDYVSGIEGEFNILISDEPILRRMIR